MNNQKHFSNISIQTVNIDNKKERLEYVTQLAVTFSYAYQNAVKDNTR